MAEVCLQVCALYQREVEAVVQRLALPDVVVQGLAPLCDRPPAESAAAPDAVRPDPAGTILRLGGCWSTGAAQPVEHCLSLLVGPAMLQDLAGRRAYAVSPGWLEGWPQRLARWGFDQAGARAFFAEFADRLVLLDTGVDPQAGGHLDTLAAYLDLASERLTVGLDYLQLRVEKTLAEQARQVIQRQAMGQFAAAHREAADYALAVELLGDLAGLRTEPEVFKQIRQIAEMLLGPSRVLYVAAGPAVLPPADPAARKLLAWVTEGGSDWMWTEAENGFRLRLAHHGEVVGGLEVNDLPHWDRRQQQLDTLLNLAPLCALAVANARAYARLAAAEAEIRQHAAQLEQRVTARTGELMRAMADLEQESAARQRLAEALRESVQNLQTVFQEAPLAIAISDVATGRLLEINGRYEQLIGYPRAELLGRTTLELGLYLNPTDRARMADALQREGVARNFELMFKDRAGQAHTGLASAALIPYNGEQRMLSLMVDITDRKQADQALRETQAQLAQRVAELEEQTRQLRLLAELEAQLQTALDLPQAFLLIAEYTQRLFPQEPGALYVQEPFAGGPPLVRTWGGLTPAAVEWCAVCPGLPAGAPSAAVQPAQFPECVKTFGPDQVGLCLTLYVPGGPHGILHLRPARAQREARQAIAAALAEQLNLALANLCLRESLREQASHDPLTGLYNRQYMQEALERELKRAARLECPVSLVLLDLDHFKRFNDRFGHLAGDELLRRLGAFLASAVRAGDVACRYGGEEFLIILPEARLVDAGARAEQWRAAVQTLPAPAGEAVTVSIGVAAWPEHGPAGRDLIAAADRALYAAKAAGRNRVVCASSN